MGEAQNLKKIEDLELYLQHYSESTILVLLYSGKNLDARTKFYKTASAMGAIFVSPKVNEDAMPQWISDYFNSIGMDIEPQAASLLAEYAGNDLRKIALEGEKLIQAIPINRKNITVSDIETNIGISKDYNNFELRSALVEKDVLKANKIVKYFEENPKTNPIQMTLSLLFGFYSNLMMAYYAPEKSEQGIAAFLGLKSPWQAREYMAAMRKYSGIKTMQIISEIRTTDAKSKGVENSSLSDGDLLRELVFKILH